MQRESQLRPDRIASLADSIWLVVGVIVGVGIYQTPPTIAGALQNEHQFYTVWLAGALLTICGVLTYVELCTTFPEDGGDYQFLKRAYGEMAAFLYGWSQTFLIRPGMIAALAFPAATYIRQASALEHLNLNSIASIIVIALTASNMIGARAGFNAQKLLTSLNYLLLISLAAGGIFLQAHPSTIRDLSEPNFGLALLLVLFCYGGWSELALIAGEVRNPERTFLPAYLIGVGLVTTLYCLLSYSYVLRIGFVALASTESPATHILPSIPPYLIAALISLSCCSSLNGVILSGARISRSFGADFKTFSFLGALNRDSHTPRAGYLAQSVLAIAIIFLASSFTSALVYTTSVVWTFYLFTGLSIFIFRSRGAVKASTCKVWGYPLTPVMFCASCAYVVYSALLYDPPGSAMTLFFLLLGVPVYYVMERKAGSQSKLEV